MTREQLISQIESEIEGVTRMRLARRIAPRLISQFGIFPNGVDLIPWLTQSRCRSNSEALVDWIETQLEDPTLMDDADQKPKSVVIADRLKRRLATVRGSYPW